MKKIFKYLIVMFLMINFAKAENINGWFVSFGGGFSSASTDFKDGSKSWQSGEQDIDGLAMSLKLGYGVSDDLTIYLFRNSVIGKYENDPSDDAYGNCVSGLGFNYYLDSSNIFYIIAGAGEGEFSKVSDAVDDTYIGDGYMLGFGVNLTSNWHLELTHLRTDIDDRVDNNRISLETQATQVLINYYWH